MQEVIFIISAQCIKNNFLNYCRFIGGTVDLIVFRVEMDAQGNRKFRESTKGVGKSCGSTFIDRNFRKHLRKKLKKVIRRSPNGTIDIPDAPLDHMMDVFVGNVKIQHK
jgi:hypothetical protein